MSLLQVVNPTVAVTVAARKSRNQYESMAGRCMSFLYDFDTLQGFVPHPDS